MSHPTTPSTIIKWLSFQDILRRRAQNMEKSKIKLHLVGLAIALIVPLSSVAATELKKIGAPELTHVFVGVLGILGLLIEFVGQLVKSRMTKIHVISRRALAIAMPAEASGYSPPEECWTRILDQSGLVQNEISQWAGTPENQQRFGNWWASNRSPGSEDRLSALLLENVIWSQAILHSMANKRNHWRLVAIVGLVAMLLTVAAIRPVGLTEFVEFLLVPLLLFSLAFNGLNTTDLELWQDAANEIDAVHDLLHGIDNRADRLSLRTSLVSRYLCLTSAIPPISTQIYSDRTKDLKERVTNEALEKHLQGR